jgi:hypothetical protein
MRLRHIAMLLVAGTCALWSAALGSQEPSPPQEFPSTTGNAFIRQCSVLEGNATTGVELQQEVACIGFVEGFINGIYAEAVYIYKVNHKEPPKPFCLPAEVENGQLVKVALKYIRNHPEEAHQPSAPLIVKAFEKSFPCQTEIK